jgi:hypothetical protein
MTVNNQTSKISYQGNGSTTTWSFPFAADQASSVFLFLTDDLGHVNQVAVGQYTVTLNAPVAPNPTSLGGSVVYPLSGPPLAAGNTLTIVRLTPDLQLTSISNQSIVYPPIVEQQFDYRAMIDQQLAEASDRAVKVGIGDSPMAPLPPKNLRLNLQAVFNANGDLTAGGAVIGTIISSAMVPVVTAASLPAARTAMGVPPVDSPAFTGNPTAPTATLGDNDTTIATTAFVQNQLSGVGAQFPSGTRMLFQQTTAPPGWTKDVTHHDKALRIVNGTVGSGGTLGFLTAFGKTATDAYTLTVTDIPPHNHAVSDPTHAHGVSDPTHTHLNAGGGPTFMSKDTPGGGFGGTGNPYNDLSIAAAATGISISAAGTGISLFNTGGGGPHSHGMDTRVLYVDVIIAQKD